MPGHSLNARAGALADRLAGDAALLRVGVAAGASGETLIDCGAQATGSLEAGLRLAEICMGGLGVAAIVPSERFARWPWQVVVRTADPVTACLASQYAGWTLQGECFTALGSGPARALARKEAIFDDIAHSERAARAILFVEAEGPPPPGLIAEIASDCRLAAERLTILFAPTRSLAGSLQVAARIVEVAVRKAHALKFPLDRIADGLGSAPLTPPHPDAAVAMGRTNDAIIYGGRVQLFVTGSAADAQGLAEALPSCRARDYGAPFAEIFTRAGGDFQAVDPMLFSPAEAIVTALETGETFHSGAVDGDMLDASLGSGRRS